jgi:hypothetical protein
VCLIRIDDFADLNDTLGHRNGDLLLDTIGLRLREVVTGLAQGASPSADQPGAAHRYLLAHLAESNSSSPSPTPPTRTR